MPPQLPVEHGAPTAATAVTAATAFADRGHYGCHTANKTKADMIENATAGNIRNVLIGTLSR